MLASAAQTVDALNENDEDFDWFPSTQEIIQAVNKDIDKSSFYNRANFSILDIGAGDGRVLNQLTPRIKYAIEKASHFINSYSSDIVLLGRDFMDQTLIDKNVSIIFMNPPFSEMTAFACKVIEEAYCKIIYLVLPERWKRNKLIKNALETRGVTAQVMGEYSFLKGDRPARGTVNLVRIQMANRYSDANDPFPEWFKKNFAIPVPEHEERYDTDGALAQKISKNYPLVERNGLVPTLVKLYNEQFRQYQKNYSQICLLDPVLLKEMGVDTRSLAKGLQLKIRGLKALFWKNLFDQLDSIKNRLCSDTRASITSTINSNVSVDFSLDNATGIVMWVIHNANLYIDQQLLSHYSEFIKMENIKSYKSNQKTFQEEQWRYRSNYEFKRDASRYKLEYRVILDSKGGLTLDHKTGEGRLTTSGENFVNDWRVIATNLGFDTAGCEGPETRDWTYGKPQKFQFYNIRTQRLETLFEVKTYQKGSMHFRFNQAFMLRLNVEFGRLKGWLHSSDEAAEEFEISTTQAKAIFNSNLQLDNKSLPLLLG